MRALIPIQSRDLSQACIDTVLAMQWAVASQIDLVTFVEGDAEAPGAADSEHIQIIEDLAIALQNELQHCEIGLFVRNGVPEDQITSLASSRGSDFIIIDANYGDRQSTPFSSSISDRVLNAAPCPVIVARANQVDMNNGDQSNFNSVLIPIDDSMWTDAALTWVGSLTWGTNTRFILAAVIESSGDGATNQVGSAVRRLSDENRQMLNVAQQFLGLRARQLAGLTGLTNISVEVGFGNTVGTILQLSQRVKANLIVMGSRGKSGIKKAILGSTSQAVSTLAPCSVAVVRGITESDRGWNNTAVFTKPKAAAHPQEPVPMRPRTYGRNTGQVPHIVPSGIG